MEKLADFLRRYGRFALVALVYVLVVIWTGGYWWLLGLPIVYDFYVSKRVHWLFWRKKGVKRQSALVEWIDALLFAGIAALLIRLLLFEAFKIPSGSMEKTLLVGDYIFVSKVAYGPKMPNTPVSFPFVQHTLPFTESTPSYTRLLEFDYDRRAGFGDVERNDVVVFQFPEGDTVIAEYPERSYYAMCRELGRDYIHQNFNLLVRPVDHRENYIKRCVAIPGDTLRIVHGQVYINGQKQRHFPGQQYSYYLQTNGVPINPRILDEMEIYPNDRLYSQADARYMLPLTQSMKARLEKLPNILATEQYVDNSWAQMQKYIFPHSPYYRWTEDEFGPLVIPKRGVTVPLTLETLPLYRRIIECYEGHRLEVRDTAIIIDGQRVESYTFGMDYYWMMGDNRHHSLDSRFWGFVPEDHVVGKAVLVWMSSSPMGGIRWSRIFTKIR
ncbi:MAG: signal peptidase I [Bacteroidetes bacterium]|nr:MAG: signal peptidase I [Bacteroidota bacterium]